MTHYKSVVKLSMSGGENDRIINLVMSPGAGMSKGVFWNRQKFFLFFFFVLSHNTTVNVFFFIFNAFSSSVNKMKI